ncbi:hypothetical protein [Xanthobacter sp. KR7-225]|uniref:hypothetical protein n=1 Tax=Xanthobacter sp. KR7-225 TaxID=3156613 RepID=UPI0032B457A7
MVDKATLVEAIISDLIAAQTRTLEDLTKNDPFGLPRLLPAGNGETIQIDKAIDDNITKLASILKAEKPELVKNVREEEWRSWLRSAIGLLLMNVKTSDPVSTSAASVLAGLNVEITSLIAGLGQSEFAFGTTFLDVRDLPTFNIGPVTFETREKWLDRKLTDGGISETMHRRIARAWGGAKLRPRRKNVDNIRERDILDILGNTCFVCSVKLDGLSGEASREFALSAARLGLTCVAMLWEQSAKALSGMNLRIDQGMRKERMLRFVPSKIILQGSRMIGRPSGPSISASDLNKTLAREANFFSAAGEVLAYFVSSDGGVARPELMNALMQSLLWFHEGCRERNDLLAVVDFAASLDALGGGKKARAILEVIEARLGAKGADSIYPGGPTLKVVVDTIYSDGRSRAIHGTSDKIGHDWTRMRSHAEALARHSLFASLSWAGATPQARDPELLKK